MVQDAQGKSPVARPSAFRILLPCFLILFSIAAVPVLIALPANTRRADLRNSKDPWVRKYYQNDWVLVSVFADLMSISTALLSIFFSGGIASWEVGDCFNFKRRTVIISTVIFLNLWLASIAMLCYAAWYINFLAAKGDTSKIVQIKLETNAAIGRAVVDFICFLAYLIYAIVLARSEKLEYYLIAAAQEQIDEYERDSTKE